MLKINNVGLEKSICRQQFQVAASVFCFQNLSLTTYFTMEQRVKYY